MHALFNCLIRLILSIIGICLFLLSPNYRQLHYFQFFHCFKHHVVNILTQVSLYTFVRVSLSYLSRSGIQLEIANFPSDMLV